MREYILLLPIIFIFHDMEEIIGFGWFFRNNPQLYEKYPRVTKAYRGFTTEGMALAVYEEFVPFFGFSLLAYYIQSNILFSVWFGLLLSLTLHFIVHIGQSILLRKYIPSFITSIICLPICMVIILKSAIYISFSPITIILVAISILFMMLNLKFAHFLMHKYGKRLSDKGLEEN